MTDAQKLTALRVVVASSVGVIRKVLRAVEHRCGTVTGGELRNVVEALEKALAQSYPSNQASEMFTKEQVKPLVTALENVLNSAVHPNTAFRSVMVPLDPVREALAHARSIGILSDVVKTPVAATPDHPRNHN